VFIISSHIFSSSLCKKRIPDVHQQECRGERIIKEDLYHPFCIVYDRFLELEYVLVVDRERPSIIVFWKINSTLGNDWAWEQGICPLEEFVFFSNLLGLASEVDRAISDTRFSIGQARIERGGWKLVLLDKVRDILKRTNLNNEMPKSISSYAPNLSFLSLLTMQACKDSASCLDMLYEDIESLCTKVQLDQIRDIFDRLLEKLSASYAFWMPQARYCLLREIFTIVTGHYVTLDPLGCSHVTSTIGLSPHPSVRCILYESELGYRFIEIRGHAWLDESTQLILDNGLCVELEAATKWGSLSCYVQLSTIKRLFELERSCAVEAANQLRIEICTYTHPSNLGHMLWNEYSGYAELSRILCSVPLVLEGLRFEVYDSDFNPSFSERSARAILYPILQECIGMTGAFESGISLNINTESNNGRVGETNGLIGQDIYASFKYPIMSPVLVNAIRKKYSPSSQKTSILGVFLNIRTHNKRHINIAECISELISVFIKKKSILNLTLDNDLVFDIEASSVDENVLSLVEAIRKAGINCYLHERLDIDELCSLVAKSTLCICPIGSGAILPTWIFNKPTVLHGDKMHMDQLSWWSSVSAAEHQLFPIEQTAITDNSSEAYSDYFIDPESYTKVFWEALKSTDPDA
jgi:hypothetical protein